MQNDVCAGWISVYCDGRRRVTGINLSSLSLNGNIDLAFGSLHALEAIVLSGNNIVGEILTSVAQRAALHVLDVTNNNLHNTMPKFLDDGDVTERNPRLGLPEEILLPCQLFAYSHSSEGIGHDDGGEGR
jgi:hypothetical protein